ncbi:hypothetical protein M446_3061 [Methylobacterium sp. 4-46]|uniref:hypothetical protein n=1 Tax=unclassified Methylobacterium TaxID=2615210 RepID=UPI000152E32E|nr:MULTISPECIES: hypothetical protein [unclassified Methylobacterium]ACA17472.1 hypothetical protein M446_3061 [Methylobacterium sp. 4-46]
MRRPLLIAGLLAALAAPASADGMPEVPFPRHPAGARPHPARVPASAAAYPRPVRDGFGPPPARSWRGPIRVQPVGYGETDGAVYHAWMPRNDRLPIYNEPPPVFPEE